MKLRKFYQWLFIIITREYYQRKDVDVELTEE